MNRRIALATAAMTAAALCTGITWSSTANAATPAASTPPVDRTISLATGNFSDLLVDKPAGKLVIAGSNGVAVGDLDGSGMSLVPGVHAAEKLTLGPDGKVYVTQSDNHIRAFDPTDFTPTDPSDPTNASKVSTWTLGSAQCPSAIAFAGSDLWFSYSCDATGASNSDTYGLGHLNTADNAVVLTSFPFGLSQTQLMSVPGNTGELIATNVSSAQDLSILTVSGSTVTVTRHTDGVAMGGQLALAPDNNGVIVANVNGAREYLLSDLSVTEPFISFASAASVAVSGDGKHLAVATGSQYAPVFQTFDYVSLAVVHDFAIPAGYTSTPNQPAAQSLAWNDDTLYSVYTNYSGVGSELHILNTALQAPSAMSLRSATSVGRAKPLLVTGHLAAATGSSAAGASVLVAKRDAAGAHPIGTFTTDAAGMYHFTDVPRVGGVNTYVAVFSGDKTHGPITKVDTVTVLRGTVPLSMKLSSSLYSYHQLAHLTVHLASHDVKKVQIWIAGGGVGQHYYTTLTVNSHGDAAMNMTMAYNTLFVVKFYGDYYYNPRVIATSVQTRVALAIALAGNYGSSGAYKLFHPGSRVYQGAIAAPDKSGSCLRFEAQQYVNGVWSTVASLDCGTNESGVSVAVFTGGPAGRPFRARAIFPGDGLNAGNSSAWVYFLYR